MHSVRCHSYNNTSGVLPSHDYHLGWLAPLPDPTTPHRDTLLSCCHHNLCPQGQQGDAPLHRVVLCGTWEKAVATSAVVARPGPEACHWQRLLASPARVPPEGTSLVAALHPTCVVHRVSLGGKADAAPHGSDCCAMPVLCLYYACTCSCESGPSV